MIHDDSAPSIATARLIIIAQNIPDCCTFKIVIVAMARREFYITVSHKPRTMRFCQPAKYDWAVGAMIVVHLSGQFIVHKRQYNIVYNGSQRVLYRLLKCSAPRLIIMHVFRLPSCVPSIPNAIHTRLMLDGR